MARTVEDLARLLDVIAGVDPADPGTAGAAGHIPPTYSAFLKPGAARGRRIGVLRAAFEASDPQVLALFDRAIADLRDAGAEIVDPFVIPEFAAFTPRAHPASEVRAAIERYLAATGDAFPKSLADVLATKKFHPLHEIGLMEAAASLAPADDPVVHKLEADEVRMRAAYLTAMDEGGIDGLVMPVASYPPKLNGDRNTTPTGITTAIASALHWPAITVPMGFTYESLPSGLQIVGRPWSEPTLLGLAFAYEQATRHRRAPGTTPPLDDVDDPAVLAEVTQCFNDYNAAIDAGDSAQLNAFFWDAPQTVRFGGNENLFGHAEIAAFRSTQWKPAGSPRQLVRAAIATIGRDTATTNAIFRRDGHPGLMRQSQTWQRRPEGWRIIAAHVSTM
jgi:hypothetical protein